MQQWSQSALVGSACAVGALACVAYHVLATHRWHASQPPQRRAGRARLPITLGGGAGDAGTAAAAAAAAAGPTVVLIHGMGCSALEWAPVAGLLRARRWAALDRVLSVDAAALAQPRTAEAIIAEAREALAAAGVAPPYVLVGHSFGGLIARAWALQHRGEVAALLMLDAMHERFVEPPMPRDFRAAFDWAVPLIFATLAAGAPLGLARLLDACAALGLPPSELLPPAQRAEAVARYSRAAPWRIAELERRGAFASLAWLRSLGALDAALPAAAVVAGRRNKSPTLYRTQLRAAFIAQAEEVLGSGGGDGGGAPRGELRRLTVAERSEPWVHLEAPELVAAEVERLCALAEARAAR
jgi:pimeloyl-ACP methyl ester carboxylesterase